MNSHFRTVPRFVGAFFIGASLFACQIFLVDIYSKNSIELKRSTFWRCNMQEFGLMYKNADGTYARVRVQDQLTPDVNGTQDHQGQNRLVGITTCKEKNTKAQKGYKQPF